MGDVELPIPVLPLPTLEELSLPLRCAKNPPCGGKFVEDVVQLHEIHIILPRNPLKEDESDFATLPSPNMKVEITLYRPKRKKLSKCDLVEYALYHSPISWRNVFLRCLKGFEVIEAELTASGDRYIRPGRDQIFRVFELCPLDRIEVCILGQDPYPDSKACGVAFSVPKMYGISESVQNIYREQRKDLGKDYVNPSHADLTAWAQRGIFLLNSALTCLAGESDSHGNGIWDEFISATITEIVRVRKNVVFMLWGTRAQGYEGRIPTSKHKALVASHPSPRSYSKGRVPFKDCHHFRLANEYRAKLKPDPLHPIDWSLPSD